MRLAGDGTELHIGAAFPLGRTNLTVLFECPVFVGAARFLDPVWIRVIAPESEQCIALRTDVLIVFFVPYKVRPRVSSIRAFTLVDHWYERDNATLLHEPAKVRS